MFDDPDRKEIGGTEGLGDCPVPGSLIEIRRIAHLKDMAAVDDREPVREGQCVCRVARGLHRRHRQIAM